jgi:hypothetical protein
LIGWRSQLCSYLLDRYRKIEVAFALDAIEHRGKLESFLLDAVQDLHPGHTLAPLRRRIAVPLRKHQVRWRDNFPPEARFFTALSFESGKFGVSY